MWRCIAAIIIVLLTVAGYILIWRYDLDQRLFDSGTVRQLAAGLGAGGPLLIVGLLAFAIVLSPIPSAPIALASGALYGHILGTIYVVLGAELGALIAFILARWAGHQFVSDWLNKYVSLGRLRRLTHSQNALMATVFFSRLMPFLSFDIISYAAGLTDLKPWRFALATIAGILPASFLLAHFGEELASGDIRRFSLTLLALGGLTILPFAFRGWFPSFWARFRSSMKRDA